MKLENNSTLLAHQWLELITYHINIKFWHIVFLVPFFVQLFGFNELCELDVSEPVDAVVFWELAFEKGAQGCFAHTWSTSDEDVW